MTRNEVMKLILSNWKVSKDIEKISIESALNRYLAEDLVSISTIPVVRSSSCDGIAIKYEHLKDSNFIVDGWVINKDFVYADTGDDFLDQYDTVIRVEDIYFKDSSTLKNLKNKNVLMGDNISPSGSILSKDEPLLKSGVKLTPSNLCLIASSGISHINVYSKPKIAFIPTGSELISFGNIPKRGENIDSNSILIKSFFENYGIDVKLYPIIKDNKKDLEIVFLDALENYDIIIINGGSSVGSEDFTTDIIKEHLSIFKRGIKTIPGRPLGMGVYKNSSVVINLPGPPYAALATLSWTIEPLLNFFNEDSWILRDIPAILTEDLKKPEGVEMIYRVKLYRANGRLYAKPFKLKSKFSEAMSECNAVFISSINESHFKKGDLIKVRPLK